MATWMNQWEVEEAAERFKNHPVLGEATRFLQEFVEETNAHSDGWAYWRLPGNAAAKLQTFVHSHLRAGMGAYPKMPEPTRAQFLATLPPIKSFMTRRGIKAGMKMPVVH